MLVGDWRTQRRDWSTSLGSEDKRLGQYCWLGIGGDKAWTGVLVIDQRTSEDRTDSRVLVEGQNRQARTGNLVEDQSGKAEFELRLRSRGTGMLVENQSRQGRMGVLCRCHK